MTFLESILSNIPEQGVTVRRVVMGPFWTLVETDAGTGLAATQLGDGPTHGRHSRHMPGAGRLTALSARTLAENVMEPPSPARSVGLAALNALLPPPAEDCVLGEANASEWLRGNARGHRIGIVGWFPFVEALRAEGHDIEVFEKDSSTGYAMTPERASRLASCDILCITAATLLNDTLDGILAAASPDAAKILVGPSSPLCTDTLDLGFAAVCGARVLDPAPLVPFIQQGACFRQLRHSAPSSALRLLTLYRPRPDAGRPRMEPCNVRYPC